LRRHQKGQWSYVLYSEYGEQDVQLEGYFVTQTPGKVEEERTVVVLVPSQLVVSR